MRLINTDTLILHDFLSGNVPPYAILSHTWQTDEVTFPEMSSTMPREDGRFAKVLNTCRLAREHGLGFAWIDTCCIDKSSSSELTEAINSMFQWYKASAVCYVFLEDLGINDSIKKLENCKWVTRGWTLQELIAPNKVIFYNMEWGYCGSKTDHARTISNSTGVPRDLVTGEAQPQHYSVAARMSWVSRRQTTRLEDIAYCMLGIFGVNMPLLYGEGLMAFRRLQEEILRRNNDITILAWGMQPDANPASYAGALAISPSDFSGSASISLFEDDSDSISVTNKGLLISGDIPVRVIAVPGRRDYQYMLCLGTNKDDFMEGLILKKISPNVFYRTGIGSISLIADANSNDDIVLCEEIAALDYIDFYLLTDPHFQLIQALGYRRRGIHLPHEPSLSIKAATPHTLWDVEDRLFMRSKPYDWHHPIPHVLGLLIDYTIGDSRIEILISCDYEEAVPKCGLHLRSNCPRKLLRAFDKPNITNPILWSELIDEANGGKGSNQAYVLIHEKAIRISIDCEERSEQQSPQTMETQSHIGSSGEFPFSCFAVKLRWEVLDGSRYF